MTHALTTRRLAVIITGLALIPSLALAHGKGDKSHMTKTFDYENFDSIQVTGAYEIDVEVGEDYGITISGHEDEMDNLKVEVKDGTLRLGKLKKKRMKNTNGIEATITLPRLSGMNVSGVAEGRIKGVDAGDFELNISGVGELDIEGTCQHLTANVSGVGEIQAKNFECEDVHIALSGVGEADVYASNSVEARASGVGEVNVYGNPKDVSKSKGFMSHVNIK